MKLIVLYHPNSEFATPVENFVNECTQHTREKIEKVSLETREGASLASVYDSLDYPAVIVAKDDGQLIKDWQGADLPPIGEVIGYLNS